MDELGIKKVKAVALIILALSAAGYAYQFGKEVNQTYPNRTFSADGVGDIDVTPDVAVFSVSVVSEGGRNVASVQKQNSDKMNAVNAFLKEQGVDAKDLKTSQYSLNPRYDYPNCTGLSVCPKPSISGYTLTQSLTVKVRDMEKLGDMLSGVVEKGANSVSNVSFTVDDETAAKNTAREEAMKKAKEKAEAVAKAGGFRMGKIVSVYEDGGDTPTYGMGGGAESSKAMAEAAPVVEPGTVEKRVRVTITYEILQ